MAKKLTKQEIFDRVASRLDIRICEETFIGWKHDCTFFDIVANDHFISTPQRIVEKNVCHPKRALESRKQTNIKKYGNVCSLHGSSTKEKVKQTNLKKYGVENANQADSVKESKKKTMVERYGVDNPSKINSVKEKKKDTFRKNFGVDHIFFLQKQKLFNEPKRIEETGESFYDWYTALDEPKPSITSFYTSIRDSAFVSLVDLNLFICNWKLNKTTLEAKAEEIFCCTFYNKKPHINLSYRPDFKLSEQVFVNVDGLYWHSEKKQSNNNHHLQMRKDFEIHSLQLIQFHENEIHNKSNIVKSMVSNILGATPNKIGARTCSVNLVTQKEATEFLKLNHLMGSTTAKHVGLYCKNKLVSLVSYKQSETVLKIERFCSKLDFSVQGGFSKLLSYIEKNLMKPSIKEIHNWVDLRYGTGNHLVTKGFVMTKETLGWKWTDGYQTFNRLSCRANMDHRRLSEKEHAQELGWYKIYDAGQRLYVRRVV